ncbi:Protein disulfide isomerase [Entamoeba marina]
MKAFFALLLIAFVSAEVVPLTASDFDAKVQTSQCSMLHGVGHCKRLHPIFEEFSESIASKFPELTVSKVDCTVENSICGHVRGYPTVILYNNGKTVEFERQRTVEALTSFVQENL